jgi:putative inorganic carbon (hco3(-)) transporter
VFLVVNGLLAGWLTVLITNFFGFSVVVVAIVFFLFPAFLGVLEVRERFSLNLTARIAALFRWVKHEHVKKAAFFIELLTGALAVVLFSTLIKFWFADISFAEARNLNRDGHVGQAYAKFIEAISLRKDEPFYYSETGWTQGAIVYSLVKDNDASSAANMAPAAAANGEKAVRQAPNNVSYWKKLADTYYNLTFFDKNEYTDRLKKAADRAYTLAPTDVSTLLVLSTYYQAVGDTERALKLVTQSTEWKPDLAEGWYKLGEVYAAKGEQERAEEYQLRAQELEPGNEEWKVGY